MFSTEIHLFIFRRQGVTLRYAAADRDVVVGDHTYTAAAIERDAIRMTAEKAKDKMKIRAAYLLTPDEPDTGWPATQALGDWWRPHIPSDEITVVCLSWDPDSLNPPRIEWTGTAVQPAFGDSELELTCDPNSPHDGAARQGAKWQKACFKAVYSTGPRGCNLLEQDFQIEAELVEVSGLALTAAELAGTPFSLEGGSLRWQRSDGIEEERPIVAHDNTAGTVTILWGGEGLAESVSVIALPNCPGTWAACSERRPDPELHFGGAIYKPVRDPINEGVSMSWG